MTFKMCSLKKIITSKFPKLMGTKVKNDPEAEDLLGKENGTEVSQKPSSLWEREQSTSKAINADAAHKSCGSDDMLQQQTPRRRPNSNKKLLRKDRRSTVVVQAPIEEITDQSQSFHEGKV